MNWSDKHPQYTKHILSGNIPQSPWELWKLWQSEASKHTIVY